MCIHVRNQKISEKNPLQCRFTSGSKDIKSSLRGAKLPNGQPMLLDEEQNSLALLIEQVEIQSGGMIKLIMVFEARYELNCGDPKIAENYMNQAMTINELEPLVKIVRGGCKVKITLKKINRVFSLPSGASVESPGSSGRCGSRAGRQSQTSSRSSCQG